ncbi:MAG: methyl-accepting chemotaxis protein [Spirochaetaceae bacterium]
MRIRNKLIITFTLVNIFVFTMVITLNIYTSGKKMRQNLDNQLQGTTNLVCTLIESTVDNLAYSYLAGSGKATLNTLRSVYNDLSKKQNQETDIKKSLLNVIKKIEVGENGIAYITDLHGNIIYHPKQDKIGTKTAQSQWIINNRGEQLALTKYDNNGIDSIMIKVFFNDYNWQVLITAPMADFTGLVNMKLLKKDILSIKIGESGYPIILDTNGKIMIHPTAIGVNIDSLKDADGNLFLEGVYKKQEPGSVNYNWEEKSGEIRQKFAYYSKIPLTGWTLLTTGYWEDFTKDTKAIQFNLIISAIIAMIINTIAVLIISGIITGSLNKLSISLKEISEGDGDLTRQVNVNSKDELGAIAQDFNIFIKKLRDMMIKIKASTNDTLVVKDELTTGTAETTAALTQISQNMTHIDQKILELNNNMNVSHHEIVEITTNINDLDGYIDSQTAMIEESTAAITQMITSIDSVSQITQKKKKSAENLVKTAKEGGDIVDTTHESVLLVSQELESINEMATVISDIASSTNLLAMNAAIEAAHAGDAGKGFAVVADEIRKLAESSSESSNRIQDILKKVTIHINDSAEKSKKASTSFMVIDNEINGLVEAFDEVFTSTDELQLGGSEILAAVTSLQELSGTVQHNSITITQAVEKVSVVMNTTRSITEEVVTDIGEINRGTKDISSSMNSVSQSTQLISKAGESLNTNVNKFKT